MKLRRLFLIIGGLVVLAVILCVGGAVLRNVIGGNGSPTPAASGTEEEETPTGITVRGRGEIVPAVWADLSFDATGPVAEWLAEEGDVVEARATLGRLETGALERAVAQAEFSLSQAELRLEQLQEPPDEADVAAAEVAVADAEAAYAESLKNLSLTENSVAVGDEVRAARYARDEAYRVYQDLQAKYDRGESWVKEKYVAGA